MKKVKLLKILLILIILTILFPVVAKAATITNEKGRYESFGDSITHTGGGNNFDFLGLQYSNVYCVEPGQVLDFNSRFTYLKSCEFLFNGSEITKIIKSDNSQIIKNDDNENDKKYVEFARALSYIFSLENSVDRKKEDTYRITAYNDPLQLALYALIAEYSDQEVHEFFGMTYYTNDLTINKDSQTIEYEFQNAETDDKYAKIAYEVYTEACSVMDKANYRYDSKFYLYTENSGSSNQNLMIVDNSEIDDFINLNIVKKDSLNNQNISGAKFDVKIENVVSVKVEGYSANDGIINSNNGTIVMEDVSAGIIQINEIQGNGSESDIKITFTETKAPEGYRISNKTTSIYIKQDYSQYSLNNSEWITISEDTISLDIKNQPVINLTGTVWEDRQIGEKNIAGPNGLKETEENGLGGVLVELYNADANGGITGKVVKHVITEAGGQYAFENIDKTENGYILLFKYNGINYQETKSWGTTGTDSVANEKKNCGEQHGTYYNCCRENFNKTFETIRAEGAEIEEAVILAGSGEVEPTEYKDILPVEYTYENEKSTFKSIMRGHTSEENKDAKYQMMSYTGVYKNTTPNINCGLVKKEIDLAIGTDVKEATLKINEKETKYTYAQIMDGELNNDLQNKSSDVTDEKVKYNLYLYTSDYNYRIRDYNTGITNNTNPGNPEDGYKETEGDQNTDTIKELEAYVTYSVILKNQTKHDAIVDEFVYYYDSIYTPQNIVSTDKYDVQIDTNARKITFTSKNDGFKLTGPDYRVQIDLTFKLNKDADGNIMLKDNVANVAEITKYTTVEGGLIDRDSAPGNANISVNENGTPVVGQYEDDTDEAKGINIGLDTNKIRTITGTVFDDTYKDENRTEYDKDGNLNNNNTAVNDVIVQLIEIKQINGNYYEYIWQETRSGSNQVKTTSRNGYDVVEYTNSVTQDGKYEFKDFIPGNYIIRFIYGDGSTYDLTENVKTYNGQDYKSTIDANYNSEWYDYTKYTAGQSVARDNEARRLEVMAYSTTIDKENGKALEEKTSLDKTWMAAETSRINIPVEADNTLTDNVNFGLALRPQTKLVLEKHITGLKITPNGVGVQPIVDAKANIENIVNGETVQISGVTDGLATIYSDRNNRGFWQVATDIEELAQGAGLEVEYTYVLRNDGEKDYLSNTLVDEYENNINNYSNYLLNIVNPQEGNLKNTTKGNTHTYGTYLGQYYYNGNSEGCEEVSSRVETLEEAINNDLVFNNEESVSFTKTNTEAVSRNVYDTNGNLVNNVENGTKNINTIVETKSATSFMNPEEKDYSKTIKLTTTLTSVSNGELGANIPSYIAEITEYSNAAGRRDMSSEPENLSYVHSDDNEMTMANSNNEEDEFWAETIIITKPTGEDKLTPLQIALITISAVATVGVGIVLIKKFVLKR